MNESEWSVERYPIFEFRGPSGNPARADLVVMRHQHEPAVVVATERADNPGVSVTNGVEQLAAAVRTQLFAAHTGPGAPFALIEHYPAVGESAASFQEVVFEDFELRRDRAVPRIGDVKEWRTVALAPAVAEEEALQQSQAARRGLHR
ncbi:MAG: hypothetical protein WAN59_09615 [Candidatus Baltobacteraceae bacterium]